TAMNREGSVVDENPLPTMAEEIEAFESACGTFSSRPFSFIEKEPVQRKNPPASFYTLITIEEFDKLMGIIIDSKPPPEKVERVRSQSIMLQQKGSYKNLSDLKKTSSSPDVMGKDEPSL